MKIYRFQGDDFALTRAPIGGGGQVLPPCRVFSIVQKRLQISTRNYQYLLQHQFDVRHQNLRKVRRIYFLRKWHFSYVLLRDFGSKSGKCLKASRMYLQVWSNTQSINAKGCKIEYATKRATSVFSLYFSILTPKFKISISFKHKCL